MCRKALFLNLALVWTPNVTKTKQNNKTIQPITLPFGGTAPLSHMHADDSTMHALTTADCDIIVEGPVNALCAASGAQLNATKTETLLGLGLGLGYILCSQADDHSTGPKAERNAQQEAAKLRSKRDSTKKHTKTIVAKVSTTSKRCCFRTAVKNPNGMCHSTRG